MQVVPGNLIIGTYSGDAFLGTVAAGIAGRENRAATPYDGTVPRPPLRGDSVVSSSSLLSNPDLTKPSTAPDVFEPLPAK